MPQAANKSHMTAGHLPSRKPHGPFSSVEGSPDVFVNGVAALRKGDVFPPHVSSPAVQAEGSSTVFANGRNLARAGDKLNCGDFMAQGSSDVFAG